MHPYNKYPNLFVRYGGQLYFDPGYPESRAYICKIVRDIVSRYDIDAIHMDDYFYPYPNPEEEFPDNISFAAYGRGFTNKADWRRDNVNVLIKEIHETVRSCKPWVKFGVSPSVSIVTENQIRMEAIQTDFRITMTCMPMYCFGSTMAG